jgi:hypothetical protein
MSGSGEGRGRVYAAQCRCAPTRTVQRPDEPDQNRMSCGAHDSLRPAPGTTLPRLGIHRLDQRTQLRPRHYLLHLFQEHGSPRLLRVALKSDSDPGRPPGRHRISHALLSSPWVAHHLYRGAEIEGPKFEKLPRTHRTCSALGTHRTAGPHKGILLTVHPAWEMGAPIEFGYGSKTAGSCTEVHAKASPARSRRCSPALD